MKDNEIVKLPDSELQIMQIIWEMTAQGTKDIHAGAMMEKYADRIGHLKLTTVLTLISRISAKGFIKIEKRGRINCYIPLIDESEYNHMMALDFIATFYKNSPKKMLSAMWDGGILKKDDIELLRHELEEDDDEGNS